eukprot:Skav222346  [mRNA]  locus=scaffold3497:127777:137324:- [translate_table: standard]
MCRAIHIHEQDRPQASHFPAWWTSRSSATTPRKGILKRTRLKTKSQSIAFHADIELIVYGPCLDNDLQITFRERSFTVACRTMWHLNGQVCGPEPLQGILHHWLCTWSPTQWGGATSCLSRERLDTCWRESPTDRRRREIRESTTVNVRFDWSLHIEQAVATSRNGRHYIESWFLAPERAPICIRSRRLLLPAGTTQEEFKSQCISLWEDLVIGGEDINIVQVDPKPVTMMRTSAHFLIMQGASPANRGIILQCDQFPVLAKHRALLLNAGDTVLQVFKTAQVEHICQNYWRPCYLEGGGLPRQFSTDEQLPLRDGMLLHGNIMTADEDAFDTSETEETDDHTDSDDDHATDAPGTDDEAPLQWEHSSSEGDETASLQLLTQSPMNELPWAEIPWSYILDDIFGTRKSWESSQQDEDETVSLMQRNRSRSREPRTATGSNNSPGHDDEDEEDSEEGFSEDPHLIDWHVLYTDMPTNPPTVQAGPHGPSPAQVAGVIGFPTNEIVNLYIVHSLAAIDAEHVVLTECAGDHLHHASEVMLLLDVRCAGEEEGSDEVLHSQIVCRNRANLVSFMGFAQLSRLARLFAHYIHVRHNGQPWTFDDPTIYPLRNGDHIEITFDKPNLEEYRRHLVDWLYDEGVTPAAHLLTPLSNASTISPTLPFAVDLSDIVNNPQGCAGGDLASRMQPLVFNSWYISHTQFTTCRDSRVVTFSAHSPTWKNTISRVWRDVFDVHRPFTVTIVQPQPIQLGRPEFDLLPHILIEQHRSGEQIAAVITVQHKKFNGATEFLAQAAHSLPASAGRQELLQAAQVWRYGIEPEDRYHVTHDNEEVFDIRGLRRPTGQSFTIVVEEIEDPDAEDPTLLQVASRSHNPTAHPGEPSRGETEHERPTQIMCPTTGEPEMPDLTQQEEQTLDDLLHMFEAGALQRDHRDPPFRALIATYYISPALLPVCPFPRYQWLGPNPIHWKREIVQPWSELMRTGDPAEIVLVRPHPLQNEETSPVTAYILIVQHADYEACPVLTTLGEDNEFLHIARFVPRQATHRNLLQASGLAQRCLTPIPTAWRSATVGTEAILYDPPTQLVDGANVLINIIAIADFSVPANLKPTGRGDTNGPTAQIPSNECLRGDAVAQAHRPLAEGTTSIDFAGAVHNFEWFDLHFTLLHYDILEAPEHVWKPCSKPWLALPWLDQADTVWEIEVYMDGSSKKGHDHLGAGVILFALTNRGWTLAGATSLCRTTRRNLPYEAETLAAILALKAGHDTLKIVIANQGWAPSFKLCYDNLTVGQQAAGKWQSYSQPTLIHLLRSMVRLIEVRFQLKASFQHIPAHTGHPGNEAADTLADAAAQGSPLTDWNHFIDYTTRPGFVKTAEWFWFLFYQPQGGNWQGHTFCWPAPAEKGRDASTAPLRPGNPGAPLAPCHQQGRVEDLTHVIEHWQTDPRHWQPVVIRALKRHLLQEQCNEEAIRLHKNVFEVIRTHGGDFTQEPFAKDKNRDLDRPHGCFCGQSFATAQGLAVHKRHKHQIYSLEHDLVQGHTCLSCLRCFWSTQRLQQHLSYISRKTGLNRCYQALRQQGYQAEYSATNIDQTWKGASRLEAVQLPGPLLPPDELRRQRRVDLQDHLDRVEAQLEPLPSDMMQPDPKDLHEGLAQVTLDWFHLFAQRGAHADAVPELEELWLGVLTDLPAELHYWGEQEFINWSHAGLQELSDSLIDGEAEGVIDHAMANLLADLPSAELRQQAERLRRQLRGLDADEPNPVPHRPIKWATMAPRHGPPAGSDVPAGFLHQDEWLRALRQVQFGALPPDKALPVLLWKGQPTIVAGLLGLSLCGPPCETFSEARYNELVPPDGQPDHAGRGPRPLRTRDQLVGLPHLSLRELKQTRQGTAFMIQMQQILALHICHGGYYMEEHPAPPQDETRASLWTAPLTELLRSHPEVRLHLVNQWRFDAPNIKPTGVLALRLPKFPSSLWRHQNPDAQKPAQGAIGRNEAGHFRTACLKEYPGRFSKALASVVWDQLKSDHAAGRYRLVRDPPDDLMDWLELVSQRSATHQHSTAMRADYQDQFAQ